LRRTSGSSRVSAWKAPRTLKAPMRWKFSHLKKKRILGFAGVELSKGVPRKASGACGADAMASSVREVSTGVRCTCSLIFSWAACTEARVSGGQVEGSAMVLRVLYQLGILKGMEIRQSRMAQSS
jgi:hypothetical protein